MERILQIQRLLLRSRRLPWAVVGVTLAILAAVIILTTQQTRARIRAQIAGRDGEILNAVAQMRMATPAGGRTDEWLASIDDPANQLTVILETSRLSGVLGARLFDTNGGFIESFPADMMETVVSRDDLASLKRLKPASHFRFDASLSEIFFEMPGEIQPVPLLEVSIPLHSQGRLVGIAQFVIEGHSIAQEFRRLDQHLWRQALIAFVPAALLLIVSIRWAFRRLNQAHRLLAERTQTLLQANQELALAAKTSAVGAVTSHLIHGLKNPLAGLQNFVASLGAAVADRPDSDLQQAIASTRRMQAMINEVVSVLRDEEGAGQFEIPVAELVELISGKVQGLCRERGVEFHTVLQAPAMLPNRAANLIALILVNLVQNAIEATPSGRTVRLALSFEGERLVCSVQDEGTGFPEGRSVFAPCRSFKDGGSGIGLAISKQLASHLGAELELRVNSPAGCAFALSIPSPVWKQKARSVTVTLS